MDCPVCGGKKTKLFKPLNTDAELRQNVFGTPILECQNCYFLYADFIHPDIIALFYTNFCRSKHTKEDFKKLRRAAKVGGKSQLKTIKPYLPKKIRKVLDFGGGSGEAARLYLPFSQEVFITEMDPRSIKHIKEEPRLNLIDQGDLMDKKYIGFFDLIIFSNVLEHMVHPMAIIDTFSRLLNKGGQLFIEVPNEDLFLRGAGKMMVQHVNFFSVETLKTFIKRQGSFDIEDIRTCGPKVQDMIDQGKLLHDFGAQKTPGGWVIRTLLKNSRPKESISPQILTLAEIDPTLMSLSETTFSINCGNFYSEQEKYQI